MRIFARAICVAVALAACLFLIACESTDSKVKQKVTRATISNEEFLRLCASGNVQQIQAAIRNGANVNARDKQGVTPLIVAAMRNGHPEIITALLKAGADVHAQSKDRMSSLFVAASNGNFEIVTILLNAGADVNVRDKEESTPLMVVKTLKLVTALLDAGADTNIRNRDGMTPLIYAALNGNPEIVSILLASGANVNARSEDGLTPLRVAVLGKRNNQNSNEVVKLLLAAGADVNAQDNKGETPLGIAATVNTDKRLVTTLLESGADVNRRDKKGLTPLMNAVKLNEPKMITLLLKAGVDQNVKYNGFRIVDYAMMRLCANGELEDVHTAIQAGANVNARFENGPTPLMIAAKYSSQPSLVMLLLNAGANPNTEDEYGYRAIDYAKENVHLRDTVAYYRLWELSK
ncbi:MAG: ankyrin repeat domain-containing protein [Azoarcus sp.]|jgi:ankyrin repeat protein|nr:ankyrin repeat domain-containing protein [Azoarcus sp.]